MDSITEYDIAPGANLDFGFDWAGRGWLSAGETITVSTWTGSTGTTLTRAQNALGVTSVFAAVGTSGVVGVAYQLVNTITTSAGRTDSRTLTLNCKNR